MHPRGPELTPSTDPPPDGRHLLLAARPRSAGPPGGNTFPAITPLPRIYVTGHRNPDTDSIASAVGYAELMGRLDPHNEYRPVRLGEINTQTRWVLERSGAREPRFLPHVMLRVRDVMREDFPKAADGEPVREVGLLMSHHDLDLLPIVDDNEELAGVMTERALARRYIRESREPSELDAPTTVGAIARVLEGELVSGDADAEVSGQIWCMAMDIGALPSEIGPGDVAVVGNRDDAQRAAISLGVGLLVASNGTTPSESTLALAAEEGVPVVTSPLDSYVTARMVTLCAPCRSLMDPEPLTVRPDDLLSDVADEVKEVHYRAAVAVDSSRKPIGLITRTDLLNPRPRRVLLVDHAEQAQSVIGVEQAEIVEILDHHHIGSIETTVPVRATFDPVGSTATLVIERFRQNGLEPSRSTAILLLCAIMSDTVILNSPTTTERDRTVVEYLQRVLALDPIELGREMFTATSNLAGVSADAIVARDAKEYEVSSGQTIAIAQVETVGQGLDDRREELQEAMRQAREKRGHALYALMVTDILAKDTDLYVSGDAGPLEAAFGTEAHDGVIPLPGVMSRKKQVAPKVLAAL
ncbi:putative manganese-dependent inorganic diphosphatase [Solirubrobacter ginsenosidimutans]|uniref:inorganic diphosphatase n=1 Tax=Solirubrobacter ginsenosidimutans TaxID=490573 RepID=A0A9X3MXE9_9ACTN|nr:putative manganese-dependent inorganic diphosphatase [Solirubrobacter ginsenosidimutans]MDA0164515.1 putative manganese-dependent inorganic diphosphatase [Solirubrobacter ginsenosidimutans]